MPKYTFICPKCELCKQMHVSRKVITTVTCDKCENTLMIRQLPTLNGNPDVTEVVNKYTGQTAKPDHSKIIKERRDHYYWSVEVPRLVTSGVYGMDTMLENGWVWFDDNKQMHVHIKPPYER